MQGEQRTWSKQHPAGGLRLSDVLGRAELRLELLTALRSGPRRKVKGAHAIEIANPTRWTPPHWVMLTTGLRLRGRRGEQRALIQELVEHGIAALGYSIGINTKQVPYGLLDEAERLNFPVFTIPFETPSRSIIDYVHRALLATDDALLKRALAVQDYLLGEPDADIDTGGYAGRVELALVDRLQVLVSAKVMLARSDGHVSHPPDAMLPKQVQRQLAAAVGADPTELRYRERSFLAFPVHAGSHLVYWLLVPDYGYRRGTAAVEAVAATVRMLGLLSLARLESPTSPTFLRAELLNRAMRAARGGVLEIDQAARRLGFDKSHECHGVVVAGDTQWSANDDDLALHPVARTIDTAGLPYLLGGRERELLLAVQASEEHIRRVLASAGRFRIGVGRGVDGLERIGQSIAEASFVLARAPEGGADVRAFDELPLATWSVGRTCDSEVGKRSRALLGLLRSQPLALEALIAYLRADQDVVRAARELHLHPNSVRYRLSRVEELLRRPVKSPETVASVYIALVSQGLM
ncbi:MAG: PucR family transcriptional regulator [Nocardioidaceae bacterium]